jgi:peptidoglycan/xylan/chitin deacetylase (PgdA/CDA1 family)
MTVPQVQTLIAEGNEIGSHTMMHPDLTTLSATEAETELRDSQAWLKTQFGLSVRVPVRPGAPGSASCPSTATSFPPRTMRSGPRSGPPGARGSPARSLAR